MILIGRILQTGNDALETSTLVQQATSDAYTYLVSIPFFGYTDGQSKEYKVEATAATFPGVFFDYKKDDIVYLSFFQNDIDGAIILGKVLQTNLNGIANIKADKIEASQITLVKEQTQGTTNVSDALTTVIDGQNVKTTNVVANTIKIKIDNNEIDVGTMLTTLNNMVTMPQVPSNQTKN